MKRIVYIVLGLLCVGLGAFLIRAIAAERERNGLPEKEVTRYTNFIR